MLFELGAIDASSFQIFQAESRHLGASNEIDDAERHLRAVEADHRAARAADIAAPSSVTGERRDYHYRRLMIARRRVRALGGEV